jgi:quinol monooxygenase YgiN
VCLVFAERRCLVIIVRITMNALIEKRTEVMQTLLSMIEPTENERGCLGFHAFRDIEDKNGFDLIAEWETREDLDHYIRSDRFSVLLNLIGIIRNTENSSLRAQHYIDLVNNVLTQRYRKRLFV